MTVDRETRSGTGREQLVLCFHGLGPVPSRITPDEAQYWCDILMFEALLDTIGPVATSSGASAQYSLPQR